MRGCGVRGGEEGRGGGCEIGAVVTAAITMTMTTPLF